MKRCNVLLLLYVGVISCLSQRTGRGPETASSALKKPEESPLFSKIVPDRGPTLGGTLVTLHGAHFSPKTQVTFGTAMCLGIKVNPYGNTLTCTTPATKSPRAVSITLSNPEGKPLTQQNAFTYETPIYPPPTLANLFPAAGPIAGGTLITLMGTAFQAGASVMLGTSPCDNPHVNNAGTEITCTTEAASIPGPVDVTVTNPDGQSVHLVDAFTYQPLPDAPLSLTRVMPDHGPIAGGIRITLYGSGFKETAVVKVGGIPCLGSIEVNPADRSALVCVIPAGVSAGVVDITVANPDGVSVHLANAFTYQLPALTLSHVTPKAGSHLGGTVITIEGSQFDAGATATLGTVRCGAPINVNAAGTRLICTTAASTHIGAVDVVVTNADGRTATLPSAFTYSNLAISYIAPNSSPLAGGTPLFLRGFGLVDGTTVHVGGQPCLRDPNRGAMFNASHTEIRCWIPRATRPGTVDIVVTNPAGHHMDLPAAFTYERPSAGPAISAQVTAPPRNVFLNPITIPQPGTLMEDERERRIGSTCYIVGPGDHGGRTNQKDLLADPPEGKTKADFLLEIEDICYTYNAPIHLHAGHTQQQQKDAFLEEVNALLTRAGIGRDLDHSIAPARLRRDSVNINREQYLLDTLPTLQPTTQRKGSYVSFYSNGTPEAGIDAGGLIKELKVKLAESLTEQPVPADSIEGLDHVNMLVHTDTTNQSGPYTLNPHFQHYETCSTLPARASTTQREKDCYQNIGKLFAKSIFIEQLNFPVPLSNYLLQRILGNPITSMEQHWGSLQLEDKDASAGQFNAMQDDGSGDAINSMFNDVWSFDPGNFFHNKPYEYYLNQMRKNHGEPYYTDEGTSVNQAQVEAFLAGFHEIVPEHFFQVLRADPAHQVNAKLLQSLLDATPVTVPELLAATQMGSLSAQQQQWFREIVMEEEATRQALVPAQRFVPALLFFATSSKTLTSYSGHVGITLDLQPATPTRNLPNSHTCFNRIDIPPYTTKADFKRKLIQAVDLSAGQLSS